MKVNEKKPRSKVGKFGYQPKPQDDKPSDSKPNAGYQPTSEGDNPTNKPEPPKEE